MKKPHQHFIPQTYLKKFSHSRKDKTFFVDVFDKQTGKYISDMSVTNICVETDLYTLKHLKGEEKYTVENFFSDNIETKYPGVYKLLVEEKKETITAVEKRFILLTTLSMYFRTPKALNRFVDFATKLITDVKVKTTQKSMDFMGYEISLEGKSFAEIKKEIKETNRVDYIQTQIALLDQLVNFKMTDGLTVIELIGEQEFITSDNPVEIRNVFDKGFHLFDSKNSIYVPLDSKHALFIAPKDKGAIVNEIFYQKDNFVQHTTLNHSVYESAERWIIGKSTALKSFLHNFEENTKPVGDDHPLILDFEEKLGLMENILALANKDASNNNKELIKSLQSLKGHRFFNDHIDLQELHRNFKEAGLKI